MKIVLIHGQSHKGTSYHIGRALVDQLEVKENITEFFLPKDLPQFCCGCYQCLKGADKCPHYEWVKPITQSMEEADLLVFTTPVYCLRASAPMKSLLDHLFVQWISHRPKQEMYFKKAVVITAGAGMGMKEAAKDITTSLKFWGISDICIYKMRSLAMSWEGVGEKSKDQVKQDTKKLADRIKRSDNSARVSLRNKFMFNLMRNMQLKGWGACPEDKEYWLEKGWLDKKRPWKNKPVHN
jgi:multimeric flavodoxin WrbA